MNINFIFKLQQTTGNKRENQKTNEKKKKKKREEANDNNHTQKIPPLIQPQNSVLAVCFADCGFFCRD